MIKYQCKYCHGTNITRDAACMWDEDTQSWVISGFYDAEDCADCEGETRIEEVEVN